MVAAAPFQGLRFDPAVVGDPGRVIAPPYDVITSEARDTLEAMHPYNVVRLILARGGRDDPDRYQQVAKLLSSWRDEGALLLDPEPSLYLYEEAYTVRGERRVQRGVLASVTLDDSGEWILPHERTMVAPVADRLHLLQATRTNLSPIFGVYSGGGRAARVLDQVTSAPPAIDCTDDSGIGHRLWPITDPERIAAWREQLASEHVLIADGHHRYRTALAYRDAMRRAEPEHPSAPWDQTLMLLVDMDQQGPSVLASHRLLAGLSGERMLAGLADDFEIRPVAGLAELGRELERLPRQAIGYGLYSAGRSWLLTAREPAGLAARTGLDRPPLEAEVLHGPVLAGPLEVHDLERQVAYESDLVHAASQVDRGTFASLLVLRPAPFPAVVETARRGHTLPPKTTYFYPKPRDGLVLRPLEPEAFARPARS